jgi:hypothetical protein
MNCSTLKMKARQSFQTSGRFQKHVEEKYAVRSIKKDWQFNRLNRFIFKTKTKPTCSVCLLRQRVAAEHKTQTIHKSARIGYLPFSIMSVSHYSPQCSPHTHTAMPNNISIITFNWINQQDAATSLVYYLSFRYSSTCFGHPCAHHQELQQLQYQHLVSRQSVVIAVLLVVVEPKLWQ